MWLSIGWFYPCFEMSCCGGPYFSCYGTCPVSIPCLWATSGLCFWSVWLHFRGSWHLWFSLALGLIALVSVGVWFLPLRKIVLWLLPSWVLKLVFAIRMAWFEEELVFYLAYLYILLFSYIMTWFEGQLMFYHVYMYILVFSCIFFILT
jgi:hypothetical protein